MNFRVSKELSEFLAKKKIRKMWLFGSVLTDKFNEASDIDMIVQYASDVHYTLLDHHQIQSELEKLLGRNVDLLTENALKNMRNPIRKAEILENSIIAYEQR